MIILNLKASKEETTYWWLSMLRGALLVSIGILTIISPFNSYLSISLAFAIIMALTGIIEVFFSIARHLTVKGWAWLLLCGLLDMLIGSYLFFYPLITMLIVPLIMGLWLLFRGVVTIGHALEFRAIGYKNGNLFLVVGLATALMALLILKSPGMGVTGLILSIGVALITGGLFRLYLSIKLGKIKNNGIDS